MITKICHILVDKLKPLIGYKNLLSGVALIVISQNCFCQSIKKQVTTLKSVAQWTVIEITITSYRDYKDAFNDVNVDAVFYGPQKEIITRPAFWDGGKTWKIRFAPTEVGQWKMKTLCSDSTNVGLNNKTETIICKQYRGREDIYKHGFLKISPDKRYFTYADGKPFFYLGDTHWLYIHEKFNTSNAKNISSQFKYMVDKRKSQGFTVYQSEAIQHRHAQNKAKGYKKDDEPICNFRDGFDATDLPGFANIDRKFKYIADHGLVNANSAICWAKDPAEYPASYAPEYMYKLGRYWTARYGAYPVLWTVAQEIDKNMYGAYDSTSIKKWFALARGIETNDSYHHPLTAHMEDVSYTVASTSWWGDKSFHSWWAVQWQGDMKDVKIAKDFWFHKPAAPSVLYESPYEGFWTDETGAREAGYKAFQYGMYGYGYGANGVWNDLYSKNPPFYGTDYEMPARYLNWFDGANLPAAKELIHMKRFYMALQWWKMVPRFDDSKWSDFLDKSESILSSDEQMTFVVYFFNKTPATGVLKNLKLKTKYIPLWYNTRTGTYTKLLPFTSIDGTWTIPQKPDDRDWILLVKQLTN